MATDPPLIARLEKLIDDLDDRSLDDLREGVKKGTYAGDIHDAPDDCETSIIVTRGELRKIRRDLAALHAWPEPTPSAPEP